MRAGEAWFFSQRVKQGPACLIEGQPASLDDGIERAAQILTAGTISGRPDSRSNHLGSPARGRVDRRPDRRVR